MLTLRLSRKLKLVKRVNEVTRLCKKKEITQPSTKSVGQPWQLQTAKARFNALFRRARTVGPQAVIQGKEQVVILSAEQFAELTKRVRRPKSLVKFFAESPLTRLSSILAAIKTQAGRSNCERFFGYNHNFRTRPWQKI